MRNNDSYGVIGWLLIGIFAVGLYAQHWQVFPYHDDWGYAALSYVTEKSGFVGNDFSQKQLLMFLYDEYMNWSPRFFSFFIQINLFKVGLDAVRLAQVAVLIGWLLLSIHIATRTVAFYTIAFGITYFLAWPSFITIGGLYWFSASIAYVWGTIPLLLAICCWHCDKKISWRVVSMLSIAALFHEQMAVAVLAAYAILLLTQRYSEGRIPIIWLALRSLPIFIASCIILLAPGNFARRAATLQNDSQPMAILNNAGRIADLVVQSSAGALTSGMMLVSLALLTYATLPDRSRPSRWTLALAGALIIIALSQIFAPAALVLALLAWVGLLLRRAQYDAAALPVLVLLVSAVASFSLLLLAPSVAGRSLLIFYTLMAAPILHAIHSLMQTSSAYGRNHRSAILILLIFLPLAIVDAGEIFAGYAHNAPTHRLNNARLYTTAQDFQSGRETPDVLVLDRLPDDRYAETMPYQRPLIEKWMKKYYGLPPTVEFRWR